MFKVWKDINQYKKCLMLLRVWNRHRKAVMPLLSWSSFKRRPNKALENKNNGTRPLSPMIWEFSVITWSLLDQFLHCQYRKHRCKKRKEIQKSLKLMLKYRYHLINPQLFFLRAKIFLLHCFLELSHLLSFATFCMM